MNKRIRELALEAGLLNYVDNETPRHYFVHADIEMEDIEKFARLMISECASVAKETRWAVPPSQEQIARSIKEHFGVE